jgi:hypothetical protein
MARLAECHPARVPGTAVFMMRSRAAPRRRSRASELEDEDVTYGRSIVVLAKDLFSCRLRGT